MKKSSLAFLVVFFIGIISLFLSAPLLVRSGDFLFGGGSIYNIEIADIAYKAAIVIDGAVAKAYHQRARIAFLKGEHAKALELINIQIEVHGEKFMASYYIRGLIHGYRKEYGHAEEDFKKFLTWDPENWAALNDLAWVYFAQGRFEKAEEYSRQGLQVAPHNPWLLTMHGMAVFNQGREVEARTDLETAHVYAQELTEKEWIIAYPGNDPAIASSGVSALRKTIEENLRRVNREGQTIKDALY